MASHTSQFICPNQVPSEASLHARESPVPRLLSFAPRLVFILSLFALTLGYWRRGALPDAALVVGPDGHSWRFEPPRVVPPGGSAMVHVHYYAANPWVALADLTFVPRDGVPPATATVVVNSGNSCLLADPGSLPFGVTAVGQAATRSFTVSSCGGGPVEVRGIDFTSGASPDFSWKLTGTSESSGPTADEPLVLESGQVRTIEVTYSASDANPLDGGVPELDIARLRFQTDEKAGSRDVVLSGYGTTLTCPVPVGGFKEGAVVTPLTTLHLRAHQSWAPPGRSIAKHRWTVTGPLPDVGSPYPAATYAHPTFEVRGVGVYTFTLDVWDDAGTPSCAPWVGTVTVTPPPTGLWVELSWDTPGDLDQGKFGKDTRPSRTQNPS